MVRAVQGRWVIVRKEGSAKHRELGRIGWREWLSFPELGLADVKAKVDTGARTSALHAYDIHTFVRDGVEIVRFKVHPLQRNTKKVVMAEAELLEKRYVRSSSGRQTLRPVVMVDAVLGQHRWRIELTLINRDAMGFRLLLGREAVKGRFLVDPGQSYLMGHRESINR